MQLNFYYKSFNNQLPDYFNHITHARTHARTHAHRKVMGIVKTSKVELI